ncbi:hypothetical protein [Marinagarivorans algicola]|uniref:hypothetical protein n=1 Tax=Marinagarivorans algicola TaxID=1513270 RepID=UPI0006B96D38|nr:hypothetical protein [Marinagarivorans algicola]
MSIHQTKADDYTGPLAVVGHNAATNEFEGGFGRQLRELTCFCAVKCDASLKTTVDILCDSTAVWLDGYLWSATDLPI